MIAWPMFVTGIVFIIAGTIISGAFWPGDNAIAAAAKADKDYLSYTGGYIGLTILIVGILMFCGCWWVGFGLEGWGQ